jgi:hypothetical protein
MLSQRTQPDQHLWRASALSPPLTISANSRASVVGPDRGEQFCSGLGPLHGA